jgi:hypothetical protein
MNPIQSQTLKPNLEFQRAFSTSETMHLVVKDELSFRRKALIFFRVFGDFGDRDQGKEEPQNLHGN